MWILCTEDLGRSVVPRFTSKSYEETGSMAMLGSLSGEKRARHSGSGAKKQLFCFKIRTLPAWSGKFFSVSPTNTDSKFVDTGEGIWVFWPKYLLISFKCSPGCTFRLEGRYVGQQVKGTG